MWGFGMAVPKVAKWAYGTVVRWAENWVFHSVAQTVATKALMLAA